MSNEYQKAIEEHYVEEFASRVLQTVINEERGNIPHEFFKAGRKSPIIHQALTLWISGRSRSFQSMLTGVCLALYEENERLRKLLVIHASLTLLTDEEPNHE